MGQCSPERPPTFTPWFWESLLYILTGWFLLGGLVFWPEHFTNESSFLAPAVAQFVDYLAISVAYGGWAHPFLIGLLLGRLHNKRVGGRALFGVGVIGLIIGTNTTAIFHATWKMVERYMLRDFFADLAWATVTMLIGALLGALPYRRKGGGK